MLSEGIVYWFWKRQNVLRFYTLSVRGRTLEFSLWNKIVKQTRRLNTNHNPSVIQIYTIIMPTYARKYFEMSLYTHNEFPHVSG